MADNENVRIHVTLSVKTWDRLVSYMRARYGRDARVTSITIEEAVLEFLDAHEVESPTPV